MIQPDETEMEWRRPTRSAAGEYDLFAVAPPVREAEQLVAPIGSTNQAKWEAWRPSPDGERVMRYIRKIAGEDVVRGADRVSSKALVERARADLHVPINNIFTPYIARELDALPLFHGLVEMRIRTAT